MAPFISGVHDGGKTASPRSNSKSTMPAAQTSLSKL